MCGRESLLDAEGQQGVVEVHSLWKKAVPCKGRSRL